MSGEPQDGDLREATVLVVDDNAQNVELMLAFLEDLGCTLRVARDGKAALEEVTTSPPDLILLDIMMPMVSGFQVCERLKRDEKTRDIPT